MSEPADVYTISYRYRFLHNGYTHEGDEVKVVIAGSEAEAIEAARNDLAELKLDTFEYEITNVYCQGPAVRGAVYTLD
jgi:hypothetical protein